jgi:hypothetical protein
MFTFLCLAILVIAIGMIRHDLKKQGMTQSLINEGLEGNNQEYLKARPKWICAEDFKPRPLNESGANRVELARHKETKEHLLVIYDRENRTFTDSKTCEVFLPGGLEIKINEIEQ